MTMSLVSIILLILVGLILLLLEILFVPGMVLGIISVILMITGIVFSYKEYGSTTGTIVLLSTATATLAAVWWAFKSNVWKKLGVQSSIESRVPAYMSGEEGSVKEGDTGKTISRLNPMGKAFIGSHQVEVQAIEGFIDQDIEIVVVKIQQNKIFVKQKILSE